jgi:hypothetical protein
LIREVLSEVDTVNSSALAGDVIDRMDADQRFEALGYLLPRLVREVSAQVEPAPA